MEASEPRRLYEPGFEGWDISLAGVFTDYAITLIGLLCAFLLWRSYKDNWTSIETLSASFVVFSALEGLTFGFGGRAHHLLNDYWQDGEVMSKVWGEGNWGWMIVWTSAMFLGPFSVAMGLGMSLAYAEVGRGCIVYIRAFAVVVATWEVYQCATNIDGSSTAAFFWSLLTSAAGLILTFRLGARSLDVWLQAAGWVCRIAGYMVVLTVPASCKTPRTQPLYTTAGASECIYPAEFNHNAIFHVFIAASIVLIFLSVDMSLSRARDRYYQEMKQPVWDLKSASARCCGAAP